MVILSSQIMRNVAIFLLNRIIVSESTRKNILDLLHVIVYFRIYEDVFIAHCQSFEPVALSYVGQHSLMEEQGDSGSYSGISVLYSLLVYPKYTR